MHKSTSMVVRRLHRRAYLRACEPFTAEEDDHTKMNAWVQSRYGAPHGGLRPPVFRYQTVVWHSHDQCFTSICRLRAVEVMKFYCSFLFFNRVTENVLAKKKNSHIQNQALILPIDAAYAFAMKQLLLLI